MDHMNNCIVQMCTTNGTDYDRYGIGIVGKPSLLMKTLSVTSSSVSLPTSAINAKEDHFSTVTFQSKTASFPSVTSNHDI